MTIRTSPAGATLFDQVGGFERVDRATALLFERLAGDPAFATIKADADTRWHVQLLLTDILGGPMAYDGPEPKAVAARLGLDGAKCSSLIAHITAGFTDAGLLPGLTGRVHARIEEFAVAQGLTLLPAPPSTRREDGKRGGDLIEAGLRESEQAGGWDGNIFILDRDLTVVHVSPGAARAVTAAEVDLQRAFNLRPTEILGTSILRFHSAPTTLQAVLGDAARLPHDTTWSFGQVVWKAQFRALPGPAGVPLGYVVLWRDESDMHRAQAVFQRLRNQAEDLPVPVMFPDPSCENWFGNAACEHALERLAPHLPAPVNPLLGFPISLFFPDATQRRALFRDPERLPYKEQLRIGPETIAILVTPVRDQEQRYLGPQITWEIVHFTRGMEKAEGAGEADRADGAAGAPAPAAASAPASSGAPAPTPAAASAAPSAGAPAPAPAAASAAASAGAPAAGPSPSAAAEALRGEARALESVSEELQTLARLLEAAADQAEGHSHLAPATGEGPLPEAVRLAETAAAALLAARQLPPGGRREAVHHALETITGIARRTNQLAMDAALLAVQDDAAQAAEALRQDVHALAQGLRDQVRALNARTQASSDTLRSAMATAARIDQWRAQFGAGPVGE